ncbi:MAG TPA: ATP-binding protein [Nakamurella sp.]
MPARTVLFNRAMTAVGAVAVLGCFGFVAADIAAGQGFGSLAWVGLGIAPMLLLGAYVTHRRPAHPEARLLLLVGASLAVNELLGRLLDPVPSGAAPPVWVLLNLLYQYATVVTVAGVAALVALYPDGVGERPWHSAVVRAGWWVALSLPVLMLLANDRLVTIYWVAPPDSAPPNPWAQPWFGLLAGPLEYLYQTSILVVVGVVVLAIRYVRAGAETRRRTRLLLIVMAAGLVSLAVDVALRSIGVYSPLFAAAYLVFVLLITATIALGIVQFRLFDIDLVVRRSVVYALLSLAITALYLALAVGPGLAFGRLIPVEIAVLLTIAAAIAFHPVRRRMNAWADRLVFGERVSRYRLLTDFGADLDCEVRVDEVLPALADAVARGLRSSWVRVRLRGTGDDDWLTDPVGVAGTPTGPAELVQLLRRGGEVVGRIECGSAPEPYTEADRELLATLAAQAATAIANARLTAQLADRLGELERSRARIVSAQDTERRRIERDIHDGVQQDVVALILRMGLSRSQVARGDVPADDAIAALQADAGDLLGDLRELARGIRPAVLSDSGLVAALQARVAKMPLPVALRADKSLRSRRFGADVEAAAYFLVCEALTNAAKHAAATTVLVDLSTAGPSLVVRVQDDGRGSGPPAGVPGSAGGGVGLVNLRDRVEALGGTLTVVTEPDRGTAVQASLPLTGGT